MRRMAEIQSIENKNENQPTSISAINTVKEVNTAKNLIAYTLLFIGASSILDGGVDHI